MEMLPGLPRPALLAPLAVAAALGCAPPPMAAPSQPAPRTAVEESWASTTEQAVERMRLRGFSLASAPELLEVRGTGRLALKRALAAGECAVFAVLGADGVDEASLRLRRAGEPVAADLFGRRDAWVSHCAESDLELRLDIEVTAGEEVESLGGRPLPAVTLLDFRAPRSAVREWAGPPPRIADAAGEAAAEHLLARGLAAAGYEAGQVLIESEAPAPGERHRAEVELAAGQCGMLVLGAGAAMLEVVSPGGEPARVEVRGEPVLLPVCAAVARTLDIGLTLDGDDPASLAFHPLPPAPLPEDLEDPPLAIREAAAIFARHGMVLSPARPDPTRAAVGWIAGFEAEHGTCYGFAAALRGTGAIESFRLAEPAGAELARWTGPAAPALLTRCHYGARSDLVLEIVERNRDGALGREPPVVIVFQAKSPASAPLVFQP